ncbi:MAG: hypothetical protein HQP72_05770, partial [Methanoculleus sp.]|nr:hypothetical protein [Methanoculleus sp.]
MTPCPRDDGLSEVVGFVLLLGVIVVALSVYQVYAVPAAGRENEIAHMNHVKDRFVDYKISLDSLWVNDRSGVLLSMAFDLGTGAPTTGGTALMLPIFTPAGSGGTVSVAEGGARLNVTVWEEGEDSALIPEVLVPDLPLGSFTYESTNHYWVDQIWTYQMGAVFLIQEGEAVVRVAPSISVYNDTNNNTHLVVAPISLAGSDMIAGSGPVRIETRMRLNPESSLGGEYDKVSLAIEVDDGPVSVRAWKRAFDEVGP